MMMDRIREARRGSMAGVNGGLSRRRQRSSLRDSPEEDGGMEMQEMGRLRDRGGKKDRDRDRSNRSKRRRGDRMMHGSHREEGEESSEESVDEEEDDEDDDASMSVRPPHPSAQNQPPLASVVQNHQLRRGFPAKPAPGSRTWKVAEEMIGAPIPRKARSSSVKRSQECWISGGGGGDGGAEQVHRQASTSPARPSPSSTAPVSPSSSNASVRKKMKTISGTKHRPPKTFKSPSIQEIEIEVAEVLFGMTRQVPPKLENHKQDSKESNGTANEVKSKVSSPVPISSPATSQPSAAAPSNPSSSSTLLTTTAPKRKRPRMRLDEESPTSPPVSAVLPAASGAKLESEARATAVSKAIAASPRSENNTASPVVDNGGVSFDPALSNISSTFASSPTKVPQDSVKEESSSVLDSKDTESRPEKKAKEETNCPPKESPLHVNLEEPSASKAVVVSESPREDKFSIDLMGPPGKSSAEMENTSVDTRMAPKLEVPKAEGEKMEKKSKTEPKEIDLDDRNVGNLSTLECDSKNHVRKERNFDVQPDLEKHQTLKQEPRTPRAETFTDKAGPTASLPMPMQITGWPGGFPSFGYMGQVPPLPPVVPVDGCSSSSKTLQSFLPPQLRLKRCATHCYIAQNILYHQQITRLNSFWPSAAGAAPLYSSKQYNLNTAPPSDSAILGSPLQGSLPGRSLSVIQEKGSPATTAHSGPPTKEKSNAASSLIDVSQRKPQMLQQPSQPGSAGNMLAPAFIFPLNQQQAAATGVAVANRSVVAKLPPGTGHAAQSSSGTSYAALGASATGGPGTAMSFNYPGLPPNEAQYLAFLQNNAYSFPIPTHVGGAPPYRGANPAQTMPFFNVSFYPSQMLHPSQLRLPQQPPSSQQPIYSQQGHQNPSTSSGSSSSQKNTQQSQKVPAAGASAIAASNSHGFPPSKQPHLPHQARHTIPETGGEDTPSTPDSRVLQDQKNIFTHKFSLPAHSQNFALVAPATAAAPLSSGGGNHSEKQPQHQTQNQVMKMDLTPSQAFAMSFASFGGAAAAAGGAAPNGLDFSSIAQNHALLQSLPEAARHGYQISAAAAVAAAHTAQQQQNKKSDDRRSAAGLGNSNTFGEEGKVSSMSKALGNAQQQSLTFAKADKDASISSIVGNNLIDSSRTLNLIQPSSGSGVRLSSRPGSAPPPFSGTPVSQASNSLHLQPQQYQQQVLQLQKQEQQRAKPSSPHRNATVYADRMPSNSNASKFPQALAGFPPTLIQSSSATQSPQWKASPRAATPASSAAPSLTASSSVKNQISLQQQVRSPQPPGHQTQISFGMSPAKVSGQAAHHLSEGGGNAASLSPSPTAASGSSLNSVSKNLGGSPRSSAAKSGPTSLPVMPFQKSQIGKSPPSSSSAPPSSLPATNRNMPSILGNPHINPAVSSSSKPQPPSQYLPPHQLPKQQFPQPQFFFSNPYMQAQASQSDAATAAAAYFQQHQQRRPPDQQQSQQQQNSGTAGPSSSLTLAGGGSAAPDQSKGARAAASSANSKGSAVNARHPAQFATVSQFGSGVAHPLMSAASAAFPYMHPMQSVPVKPPPAAASEQKPAAGR